MSFIGQFPAKLDSKNRVFLPSNYRHQLQIAAASGTSVQLNGAATASCATPVGVTPAGVTLTASSTPASSTPASTTPASSTPAVVSSATELTLVVRKDYFENCLVIYPMEQWQAEVVRVRSKLNRFDSSQQMLYRKLVSEAMEITLDSNGRMLIPRALLEKAGIGQEVLFVGMEQTIELWAAENAKASNADAEAFMSEQDFASQITAFMKE